MKKPVPKIWLLASPHAGDNTQLFALAESLGWPYDVKKLSYRPSHLFSRFLPNSLRGLTAESQLDLSQPYPDLILGAGEPTESAALWIKQNSNKKTRVVYIGTPWSKLAAFDLIITTPQYSLPEVDNVLHISLPLHTVNTEKLRHAEAIWKPILKHLPRPWTAVLVGGASGPYTLDENAALRLSQHAQTLGGSLLITTSSRTSERTTAALQKSLAVPNYFHKWSSNNAENPFSGFLALSDQFIVTADSISMLSEACATGKPVQMFDTESGAFSMREDKTKIYWRGANLRATIFRIAMRLAPTRWTRDLRIVHRQLEASGQTTWTGDAIPSLKIKTKSTALDVATSRVRALFDL